VQSSQHFEVLQSIIVPRRAGRIRPAVDVVGAASRQLFVLEQRRDYSFESHSSAAFPRPQDFTVGQLFARMPPTTLACDVIRSTVGLMERRARTSSASDVKPTDSARRRQSLVR